VIITLLIQVRNEMRTGHLIRFVENNFGIADHCVALDDCSDDGTTDLLNLHFDFVIKNEVSYFASEVVNKQKLLSVAQEEFPDTDWFIWLDADELLLATREEIENIISIADREDFDSIELGLVNLWRSTKFYRLDSGFNDLKNIHLWRNLDHLHYEVEPGLHQLPHPNGLKKTLIVDNLKILHFGFASKSLIAEKYFNYARSGQRGKNLWRLIDESNLKLCDISFETSNLGARYEKYLESTSDVEYTNLETSLSVWDYYWLNRLTSKTISKIRPKITLVCLIYAGIDWLEFQYGELLLLQKEFGSDQIEILFVANDATAEVLDFLNGNHIPYVEAPGRKESGEWYINSVYRAYNFGVISAKGEYVFLTNSDMSYTKGFLMSLFRHAHPSKYVVGKLVESGRLTPADHAVEKNFGKKLRNFEREKFNLFAQSIRKKGEISGGLYMPVIIQREIFLKLGGYPEGNIKSDGLASYLKGDEIRYALPGENIIAGDFAFIQKARNLGIQHFTVQDAIAYHFQEGEKSDHSNVKNSKVSSGIGIANDMLLGINGERVLWNYLIDDLSSSNIRIREFALGFKPSLYRIRNRELWKKPKVRLMFRNGTFLGNFSGSWRTIALLQDKVVNREILKKQSKARLESEAIITNSDYFIHDDNYLLDSHKYLLPLPVNPVWEEAELENTKAHDRLTAIFVGAFNETKGWSQIKSIIKDNTDMYFILVSKYAEDEHELDEATLSRCMVFRNLPVNELIKLVDSADFMIIGSQFETQCLAAMEAALRNKPVCMKETGLLSTLPVEDRQKIGVFDNNLVNAFAEMKSLLLNELFTFSPKEVLYKYDLESKNLRNEWKKVLIAELQESFIPFKRTRITFKEILKRLLPKLFLQKYYLLKNVYHEFCKR